MGVNLGTKSRSAKIFTERKCVKGMKTAQFKIFKNDKFRLNNKQIKAIELLINCKMQQKEIAEEVGVSEKTIYNWMRHNEEFRKALEWYRKEVYKDYAPAAIQTILDIMQNSQSAKARFDAAKDILDRAGDNAVSKVDMESENTVNINVRTMEESDFNG